MKVEMIQDEFDKYFARAALGRDVSPEPENRRGSLPSAGLKAPEESKVRRTASCKYPARRRRERSQSPRAMSSSNSPKERPSSINLEPAESYIHEPTLRAPSPNPGVKCHSAPHSRSSSWKKRKGLKVDTELLEPRPRTGSVPLEDTLSQLEKLKILQNEDLCPVRNFTTSSKGIINRGDSFKRKSNTSVASEGGGSVGSAPEGSNRSRALSVNSQASSKASSTGVHIFKVLLLGDHGVGKTALVQQFMTSEYMGATDTSFGGTTPSVTFTFDDDGEVTVSVLLDGEETTMDFIDVPYGENFHSYSDVDAYVLVYSMIDRVTFQHACDLMEQISRDNERHAAVIMVANKSDIVRSRQVNEDEGREICLKYDCKFIEVSAALNHRVDELLVGIVSQIRLHPKRLEKKKRTQSAMPENCVTKSAKGLLDKLFRKQHYVSKSCDNLLVL